MAKSAARVGNAGFSIRNDNKFFSLISDKEWHEREYETNENNETNEKVPIFWQVSSSS